MSNFCGVISNFPISLKHTPLEFQQLEAVTEWLLGETEHLWQNFQTKCQFMQDQQRQVVKNEQMLVEMHKQFADIKINVAFLEMETHENEFNLQQLERKLRCLEQQASVPCDCLNCCASKQTRKCEYDRVLELLEYTANTMNQLYTLMEKISQCEPYIQLQSNPYATILAILEMHVRVLQQTDKNLSVLTDKTILVDEALLQAMGKMPMA